MIYWEKNYEILLSISVLRIEKQNLGTAKYVFRLMASPQLLQYGSIVYIRISL